MDINSWSAEVNKDWIIVTPMSGTLPMTQPVKVEVVSATTMTYDVNGTIVLNIGGSILIKHVKRCAPRINNIRYELTFDAGEIDLCGDVESAITNLSGFTIYELDNGTEQRDVTSLSFDDVSFTYTIDGITYAMLPKNDDELNTGKAVTVNGLWNGATHSVDTTQEGMSEDDITNEGSGGGGIMYRGFDFAPEAKNKTVESCTQGQFTYTFTGKRIESQGILTGITPCGNVAVLDVGEGGGSNIPSEYIKLSCHNSEITINDLTVSYPTNTTYSDKRYVITASIVDSEARVLPRSVSTNLYVPAGSCASGYKVWIFADKQYLPEIDSDVVTLTYFATDSDIIPTRVSDIPINERIYENVMLDSPIGELSQYFTLGSKTVKNNTNQQKVTFKKFTTESDIQFVFKAHLNDIISQNSAIIIKPSDMSGAIYKWLDTDETKCEISDFQYKWVDTDQFVCEEGNTIFRWIDAEITCTDGSEAYRWLDTDEITCEGEEIIDRWLDTDQFMCDAIISVSRWLDVETTCDDGSDAERWVDSETKCEYINSTYRWVDIQTICSDGEEQTKWIDSDETKCENS